MKTQYYRLEGHTPVPCDDLMTWAMAFEGTDRRVGWDVVDDVTISTVFLGLDHNYRDYGPPILFETMTFIGDTPESLWRYSTWDKAAAGHKAAVDAVRRHDDAAFDHASALVGHLRSLKQRA